jgi:hypothetical protein
MARLRKRAGSFGGGLGYSAIRAKRGKRGHLSRPNYGLPQLPNLGASLLGQPPPSAADISYTGGSFSGGMGGYDLSTDPAVAAAAGLSAKLRAMAQASALAKIKQAAIEYGDPTGVEGLDEATLKASRENPFSITKNLERSYKTGLGELEEGLNASNLFYSGYRGKQLGEAARGYQQSKYDASNAFRGLLTDINDRLAQSLMDADMYEAGAIGGSEGGYYEEPGEPGVSSVVRGPWQTPRRPGVVGASPRPRPRPRRPNSFGGGLGGALIRARRHGRRR